jgi:hypothetical protein
MDLIFLHVTGLRTFVNRSSRYSTGTGSRHCFDIATRGGD